VSGFKSAGVASNATATTKLTVFSDDFGVLPLMYLVGFTEYRYSIAKIKGLKTLLDAVKRGDPYKGAACNITELFEMDHFETYVQWQRDGYAFGDEVPDLPAQKIQNLGFTTTELATAREDLLSWLGRGGRSNERPASVTTIYVLVVESIIRSLEANKPLSTTDDTKDPLRDPAVWEKYIADIREVQDG